ncbi:MAG: chaperone modulator CbpM [Alphaproteobacteria bacterium]|nr:chaperone modulator CbpM [Alphaproteobacteria bacterium]
MITIDEVLLKLENNLGQVTLDRVTLENYIDRDWVRPIVEHHVFYFEEIDIYRIKLVHQLHHELMINDNEMDIILNLLDQVYELRSCIKTVKSAIDHQPKDIQEKIYSYLQKHE